MASHATIARPYAQAVFALAEAGERSGAAAAGGEAGVAGWGAFLARAAAMVCEEEVAKVLQHPRVAAEDAAALVGDLSRAAGAGEAVADAGAEETITPNQRSFLRMVAMNGRLQVLPAIAERFAQLRADAAGTVEATITSAYELEAAQRDAIVAAVEKKLGRKVEVTLEVKRSLIGGVVIRAGDAVIDASVYGSLRQLEGELA